MESCETCRYWQPHTEEAGKCRKNAPTAYPVSDVVTINDRGEVVDDGIEEGEAEIISTIWPITSTIDWCGDYKESTYEARDCCKGSN